MAMNRWIVGNWKMNGSFAHIETFVEEFLRGLPEGLSQSGIQVGICPPLPYLAATGKALGGSGVALGSQKVHPSPSGAYTGEVSPPMLKDLGVTVCLIGHSEQRQFFGATDGIVTEKLHALMAEGITPILCVGETLEEREAGNQRAVIESQLTKAFQKSSGKPAGQRISDTVNRPHPPLSAADARGLVVAYEPIWAIGTGRTATPEQANEVHTFIREIIATQFDPALAHNVPILYGGSVTPDNTSQLLAQPELNGVLVGGASLKAASFLSIIHQALN